MRSRGLFAAVALVILLLSGSVASGQEAPQFRMGFRALADQIPEVAGQPLENEHWGDNGDSLQQTSTGLMAWRKADNWTAFTNGSRTWVNGPNGVEERGNSQRFPWEAEAAPALAVEPTPVPAPTIVPDGTFVGSFGPEIYLVQGGMKHGLSWDSYLAMGGKPDRSNVRVLTVGQLDAIPTGSPVAAISSPSPSTPQTPGATAVANPQSTNSFPTAARLVSTGTSPIMSSIDSKFWRLTGAGAHGNVKNTDPQWVAADIEVMVDAFDTVYQEHTWVKASISSGKGPTLRLTIGPGEWIDWAWSSPSAGSLVPGAEYRWRPLRYYFTWRWLSPDGSVTSPQFHSQDLPITGG